jgi:hypothetical protein
MKRITLLLPLICLMGFVAVSQNVGINVANPVNRLQIGVTPGFSQNDFAIGNGVQAMSVTQAAAASIWYSNTAFSLMPNGNPYINTGFLGIGTFSPLFPVTIKTPGGVNSWGMIHTDGTVQVGDYIYANTSAEFGTRSNHPLFIFTNNADANPAINIGVDSRVGIVSGGTPVNFLQVGSMGATGYNGFHFAYGNGTQVSGFTILGNGNALWQTTSNISIMPKGNGNGNVGIDVVAPANALQIGNVGTSGYSGNHIAFGNGSQASGIVQTNTGVIWNSTTNIALMPFGNGHGRVGINTTTPFAPLDVEDYVSTQGFPNLSGNTYGGFDYFRVGGYNGGINSWGADVGGICHNCYADVAIYARGNVMASEFDAISDARIKDVKGITNSKSDLATINALQITDYTMKDKAKEGNRSFKKVIAQQVESVYPQVVSQHTDFIPNVYQVADKITRKNDALLLHFANGHHLSKNAKWIKMLTQGEHTMSRYEVLSVISKNDVLINAPDLSADRLFVYGEEVNDFRTVDYDGLTTLNISATQELTKMVKFQQLEINELKNEIKKMKGTLHRR